MDRNKQARHKATGVIFEWGKHWEMWNELADSGSDTKMSCSNYGEIEEQDCRCFACSADIKIKDDCSNCPLNLECYSTKGDYNIWSTTTTSKKDRKHYATKIRDAKLSPEWEEI